MACTTTVLGLEQIRKRTGVSLQQISESTKLSPFFLRAIESEEFDKLPGGVFNTNYIRQYAAAIGFSDARLLECYKTYVAAREAEQSALQPVNASKGWSLRLLNWLSAPSPRNS
jgi:cytoskeletal protein RodZ